jgi:hypothetical protein
MNTEGIYMRKITLCAAALAALVLIGVETWIGARTGALAGSADKPPPVMMSGAKGPPTSLNDDSIVVY